MPAPLARCAVVCGALAGLAAVASGQLWGDPVAALATTVVICHVCYQATADMVHRLADGVDPSVITTAEAAAGCPGCRTPRPGAICPASRTALSIPNGHGLAGLPGLQAVRGEVSGSRLGQAKVHASLTS